MNRQHETGPFEVTCVCTGNNCVCGISDALIGPAPVAKDGSAALYWANPKPAARLGEVIAEFGTPNILDTSPGGMARWAGNVLAGTPYSEILLKDEQIPHCCPMPHDDYLYASVCVDLAPEVQMAMLAITKSVWYDRLTHTLTARCHFMGPNVATLLLVTRMQLGSVSLSEAPGLYGGLVSASQDPATYAVMYGELAHNINVIGCPPYPACSTVTCPKSAVQLSSY